MRRIFVLAMMVLFLLAVPEGVPQEIEERAGRKVALDLKALLERVEKIEEQNQAILASQKEILQQLQTLRYMVRRA